MKSVRFRGEFKRSPMKKKHKLVKCKHTWASECGCQAAHDWVRLKLARCSRKSIRVSKSNFCLDHHDCSYDFRWSFVKHLNRFNLNIQFFLLCRALSIFELLAQTLKSTELVERLTLWTSKYKFDKERTLEARKTLALFWFDKDLQNVSINSMLHSLFLLNTPMP